MMHTKPVLANNGPAPDAAAGDGRNDARRATWPARLGHWLMPWSRLRARAADGGPPQWPMPWR